MRGDLEGVVARVQIRSAIRFADYSGGIVGIIPEERKMQKIRYFDDGRIVSLMPGEIAPGRFGVDFECIDDLSSLSLLRALPGKVILRYPPPEEQIGAIIVPETSRRRPEFGVLVDVGDALNAEQEVQRKAVLRAHEQGRLFTIPMVKGEPFWQEEYKNIAGWEWLKEYRAFAFSQLYATIAKPEE